ncbi:MAG: alpha/beta fold hydrolase [Woeseiaceae bacterium]|nr:alpha/beta fold hydrolase [Woeseiaceae bacterium]
MISAIRDNAPPKYIWLDLDKKAGGAWYSKFPHLEGKRLPEVRPIRFEARDGTTLNGYLTMPLDASGKPPLVVFPHGGPHARDYQYFDPYVQFFANRGYAVLQVNFRGSEGYGTAFETAGYRQWGRSMQLDVYDAVDWLAGQEIVDTDRKCMVGASYGGYVALVTAYQKPHDYRCIVSIAGIPDLYDMVRMDSLYTERKAIVSKMIGDISSAEDSEALKEYSPTSHVRDMRAPILMAHGTADTRVDVGQSRAFEWKAEDVGLDIELPGVREGYTLPG